MTKIPQRSGSMPTVLVRFVALLLSLCMLVGDPTWAAGVSDFVQLNFSRDLRNLSIPSRFGTITDRWQPTAQVKNHTNPDANPRPLVVLLQDLHANTGVQKNIAGTLEHLYHRYGVTS